jgi:MFS transporter, OCT family, solute carrier family 22 (organic cation transporter), member 4/5
VGATTSGVFLVAYCLSLEMFNKDLRMQAGVCFMMFFSCGYMIMGVMAIFIHDWRWYQMALTLPGLLFLTYWWFIPESVRWLITKNKKDKAIKQIQKIAHANNKEIPKEILDKFIESELSTKDGEEVKSSVLDIFRQRHLRKIAIFIFFDWFVVSGAYYGLSWSSGELVGDPKLNHIMSGAVEIPGYIMLLLTLVRMLIRSISH